MHCLPVKSLSILLLETTGSARLESFCGVTIQFFLRTNNLKQLTNADWLPVASNFPGFFSPWYPNIFCPSLNLMVKQISPLACVVFKTKLFCKKKKKKKINLFSFFFHFYLIWGTYILTYKLLNGIQNIKEIFALNCLN